TRYRRAYGNIRLWTLCKTSRLAETQQWLKQESHDFSRVECQWNDWYNGYIYLTTRTDLFSIQNLLNRMMQNIQFLSQNATGLNQASQGLAAIPTASVRMAMAVLGVLPVVIIYPFIQNNFVKGITLGGVKG
ncbi:MAG: hypothetical protein PHD23_08610, partial [Eubacteriales bacterium]|nr:hypothetical protein [Eubacteriales bacterium]